MDLNCSKSAAFFISMTSSILPVRTSLKPATCSPLHMLAALMESFCSRRFRTGNGSAHSFSCAQNHSVYSRSLCLKKPYASDLEYAFFIWLLSSKSTLCSVAPVSFFSISAILLFASSLNCVCFVSSVSPASSASY